MGYRREGLTSRLARVLGLLDWRSWLIGADGSFALARCRSGRRATRRDLMVLWIVSYEDE